MEIFVGISVASLLEP